MFRYELDDPLIRSGQNWAPNCPRCSSSNTKFCYYNNYSLSQPRYFCKNCRRYWTRGGSLRNVPVGGGCRRNRRSKSSLKSRQPPASASRYSGNSGESGSAEIDLAAVFANFLSQKPDQVDPDDAGSRSGISSNSGRAPEEAKIGEFELQCFVGDHEVEQGLLWNDVASWQPMVHVHEMEAFSSSMNNNNNNNNQVNDSIWSSFDYSWV